MSPVSASAAVSTASAVDAGRTRGCRDLTLRVVGQRHLPEPDRRGVVLVAAHEEGEQLGGPADAEHQHPGRHRVERAGVADLAGGAQPAGPGDDVVAGPAGRLVDDEDAVGRGLTRSARHPAPRPSSRSFLYGSASPACTAPRPRRGHRGVALAGLAQEVLEVGGGLRDGVGDELQARREPDAELLADERAQLALVELEQARGLGALPGIPEDGVEERGVLQVAGDPDVGDGDEARGRGP